MNAKAISFTPEVLKAKLRALEEYGRCQTRRPVISNLRAHPVRRVGALMDDGRAWVEPGGWVKPPLGWKGQKLWVRERARVVAADPDGEIHLRYELDGEERVVEWPDRIVGVVVGHCLPNGVFREGARHFLEVVEVRAEVLHSVSEDDARLDGFASREDFKREWNTIYQRREQRWLEGAHELSPWCWVYTLKRAEP